MDGSRLTEVEEGCFKDRLGFTHYKDGPYWPPEYGPLHPLPHHVQGVGEQSEGFAEVLKEEEGVKDFGFIPVVVYDSERSPKQALQNLPRSLESLEFESRFESGNLTRATRMYVTWCLKQ